MKQCELCSIVGTEDTTLIRTTFIQYLNDEFEMCHLCESVVLHLVKKREEE